MTGLLAAAKPRTCSAQHRSVSGDGLADANIHVPHYWRELVHNLVTLLLEHADAIVLRRVLVNRDALQTFRSRHEHVHRAIVFAERQKIILTIDLELHFIFLFPKANSSEFSFGTTQVVPFPSYRKGALPRPSKLTADG
jgi:hypothetical protein